MIRYIFQISFFLLQLFLLHPIPTNAMKYDEKKGERTFLYYIFPEKKKIPFPARNFVRKERYLGRVD